jgi:uncharacterized protein
MSSALPELIDAWRMVSARRIFAGRLRLDAMPRLSSCLVDALGECEFEVEFGRDEIGTAFLDVNVDARLPLVCQRTLVRFELPVKIRQRLGLIRDEHEDAALPEGYEPVLVPQDGALRLVDAIEDELILAVPVVPMSSDGLAPDGVVWQDLEVEVPDDEKQVNPFAALAGLKKQD